VKEVALPARKRNARLSFAFVYPDKNGRFVVRQVIVYSDCHYLSVTHSSLHLQMPNNSVVLIIMVYPSGE
jgi:hypothetical protein